MSCIDSQSFGFNRSLVSLADQYSKRTRDSHAHDSRKLQVCDSRHIEQIARLTSATISYSFPYSRASALSASRKIDSAPTSRTLTPESKILFAI
jgi:hypothetical protein